MPLANGRLTNPGRPLTSHYYGGESDTIREIPPEFRAALDLTVIEIPLPWDQEIIPLADTVLASKAEQTVTAERKRRTTYKPPGPVTLIEYLTNKDKQFVTRTRNFKYIADAIGSPGPAVDVKTQNLGNKHFIEDIENAQFVFAKKMTSIELPDVTPELFKALLPMRERRITFTGIVNDPQPVLGPGEYRREETQDDVFNMTQLLKSRNAPPGGYPYIVNPAEYKMTPEQQLETIVMTLDLGTQTLNIVPTMVEGEVKVLGDGTSVKSEGTTASVFPKLLGETSIPDLVPELFRGVLPLLRSATTFSGTASLTPVLGLGELSRREDQVTVYNMRREVTKRDTSSLPISKVASRQLTEEYGGEQVQTTAWLDSIQPPVESGLGVLTSIVKDLGNGLFFRETTKWDTAIVWPILIGTEVDPRTGIVIGVTKQTVAAGTTGGVLSDGYVDVKPIDKWRSIRIASKLDPSTLPAPVTWETTVEHRFPNTLLGAAFIWASASGTLAYDFEMALVLDMLEGYAGPCRAKVTESYTNGPPPPDPTKVPTIFCPKGHTVGFSWAFAADLTGECGSCTDLARARAQTWSISPSLHDAITIGGGVVLSGGSFTGTLPATTPIGLPPAGTLIVKECPVERWRFGVFYKRLVEIYVPDCPLT